MITALFITVSFGQGFNFASFLADAEFGLLGQSFMWGKTVTSDGVTEWLQREDIRITPRLGVLYNTGWANSVFLFAFAS